MHSKHNNVIFFVQMTLLPLMNIFSMHLDNAFERYIEFRKNISLESFTFELMHMSLCKFPCNEFLSIFPTFRCCINNCTNFFPFDLHIDYTQTTLKRRSQSNGTFRIACIFGLRFCTITTTISVTELLFLFAYLSPQ